MENLFEFLFRISVSLVLFFVMYWLLLRKLTHFKANRIFLVSSLLVSVLVAIFPLHYVVFMENTSQANVTDFSEIFKDSETSNMVFASEKNEFSWQVVLFITYICGIVFFSLRLLTQTWKPILIILNTKTKEINNHLVLENNHYSLPFSFFNRIFINPKYHKQEELVDILAHEKVHIRERHWIDLVIIELLTVFLWFNPFIWLFERAIKQNHEYLADEGVLSRGHSPVRYQALLINQLMGMQVIGLTHNLNFALGPTRLKMMTKQKTPKRKLLRMTWALPAIAALLVAFAQPEYKQQKKENNPKTTIYNPKVFKTSEDTKIKGIVVDENNNPMPGASIILQGTSKGTVSNLDGTFSLDVPANTKVSIVVSFVGYETRLQQVVYSENKKNPEYRIQMKQQVVGIDTNFPEQAPPPPAPEEVEHSESTFVVVEELPHYPNGHYGLGQYINKKRNEIKEQLFFEGKNLEGSATIGFTVETNGEVSNIQVLNKTTDIAAEAGIKIVKGMENWSPGKQRGKPVRVNFSIPFEF